MNASDNSMTTFRLPDLGEGLVQVEIVAWHVSVGDHVVADQPLVSVETDKAIVEIPSPQSGRVSRLHGEPGDIVAVGAALVDYQNIDSDNPDQADSVVGELPHAPSRTGPDNAPGPPSLATVPGQAHTHTPQVPSPTGPQADAPARAAPAVRRLARDLGLDLHAIQGTGPKGAVTTSDVRRHAPSDTQARGTTEPAASSHVQPLRGPRRAMAAAMTEARSQVVPASITADADVTPWFARGADPTLQLVQAIAAGCQAEPAVNVWYNAIDGHRTLHGFVDLGIAMDTADGLFVPILRNIAQCNSAQVREQLDALKEKVYARTIAPTDMQGATITLSNFGTLIGRYANLVIMPPQVAILGAGRILDQVVPINAQPVVRQVLPLSLSFDHRVVTGGEAARFLRAVVDSLQCSSGTGGQNKASEIT